MISVSEFNAALSCAMTSVGKDSKQPERMSVLLEFLANERLRLVATDGHRITYVECQITHNQPADSGFVLYSEYAKKLLRSFPEKSKGRMTIALYGEEILFTDGETVETFARTAQEFPNYRSVLRHAETPPRVSTMSTDQIIDALESFKPFSTGKVSIELHDSGPSYFIPRINPDAESIKEAVTVIMSFKPC